MEIVRKKSTNKGFSDKVAKRIAQNIRSSSLTIYDGKWKTFCKWCKENNISEPLKVSVPQLAEFLNHLFEVEGLQVRTIKGYRAAISRMLNLSEDRDLTIDPHLRALISNFSIERPVNRKTYPSWDLVLVLNSLMRPPYEPLMAASLPFLTKKLVFLLLLASGARRVEVHSLDVNKLIFVKSTNSVWLHPKESFIAKNFNVQTGKCNFEGFKIDS